ncbi:MAG: 30S ribosomal protein S20 [Bdellovibrionales bacterium]|nr:30S ribosomal protein S20 [Bdellovibrionales bacterium]
MANHKSAKKRNRQTAKRRQVNKRAINNLRTLEKNLREVIEKKDKNQALEQLKIFNSKMDRSVQKGHQHQNKVSRKKSQIASLVNSL